jgi:hypothetical protein
MSRTTSTMLPPPSDFPVPMPDVPPSEPDTGAWRALLEITRETVRPGKLIALYAELEAELEEAAAGS